MNGTVLDILIYVFDRYMFDEAPEVPEREALARDLESAGFGQANVERALDWLADLAGERNRAPLLPAPVFTHGTVASVRGLPRPAAVARTGRDPAAHAARTGHRSSAGAGCRGSQ